MSTPIKGWFAPVDEQGMDKNLPRETDTALARLYNQRAAVIARLEMHRATIISCSNADTYYRGRQRVTDRTFEQAAEMVSEHLATLPAKDLEHGYGLLPGFGGKRHNGSSVGSAVRSFAAITECVAERERITAEMAPLEAVFAANRWSRFFLVTSSPGHIHSSMHCSTCRITTAYGWLPQMSGETQAQAVAALGPTLCSVCFPDAPVESTSGKKITAAQAARLAYNETD